MNQKNDPTNKQGYVQDSPQGFEAEGDSNLPLHHERILAERMASLQSGTMRMIDAEEFWSTLKKGGR